IGVYTAAVEAARVARNAPRKVRGMVCLFGLLIVLYVPFTKFSALDASQDTEAETFATQAIETLPPNAIVISESTPLTFALWYGQGVTHQRPDIAVLNINLLAWDWYRETLAHYYPALSLESLALPPNIL